MSFKPQWYKLLPHRLKPKDKKILEKIENLRKEYELTHEMIFMGILVTPWAVRTVQEDCLEQGRKMMPNASDNELWKGVLFSRLQAKLANSDSPEESTHIRSIMEDIDNICSEFESWQEVVEYIVSMERDEGTFADPSGIMQEINLLLESDKIFAAGTNHPFYQDVKEAYKDSKLSYDLNVEYILYRKLPKPKDVFARSGLGTDIPKAQDAEEEQIQIKTIEALYRQFFKKVKTGGQYSPIEKIKKYYGKNPQERIGISSGGYYRLFVTYWTLQVKLKENSDSNVSKYGYGNVYYIDSLLRLVESNLAGGFFPSPGPIQMPEASRRQGIQE